MRLDQSIETVGLITAGNAWFTTAIILFTSVLLWRWKRARGKQVADDFELEDEPVVINTPVFGEEQIPRMPGPGNQPPFQFVMRMQSAASIGPRVVSEICDEDHLEFNILSPSYFRNPQGRTAISETDDDESDQMSTAHAPGKHAPGEVCSICNHVSERYEQRNFVLTTNTPISGGMATLQLDPSSRIDYLSSISGIADPDLPAEGTGEANHTFSTFIVSPRVESIY